MVFWQLGLGGKCISAPFYLPLSRDPGNSTIVGVIFTITNAVLPKNMNTIISNENRILITFHGVLAEDLILTLIAFATIIYMNRQFMLLDVINLQYAPTS